MLNLALLVLSCLVIKNAEANPAGTFSLKPELAALATTAETAATTTTILDSVHSLSSVGYAIEVPDTDGDEDENSPALPAIAEEGEDEDVDEDEDDEEIDSGSTAEKVNLDLTPEDVNTRENAYSTAGLKYNKDVDLPVLAQRKSLEGEDLPAVPQVIACRTDGQVAITYVCCILYQFSRNIQTNS